MKLMTRKHLSKASCTSGTPGDPTLHQKVQKQLQTAQYLTALCSQMEEQHPQTSRSSKKKHRRKRPRKKKTKHYSSSSTSSNNSTTNSAARQRQQTCWLLQGRYRR
ncbi:MAG: protein of unknown function DUF755 [Anelloviridae sp.]|nr:MAG: protein of unknown function DUF755 [Anelloviridae sp.]